MKEAKERSKAEEAEKCEKQSSCDSSPFRSPPPPHTHLFIARHMM